MENTRENAAQLLEKMKEEETTKLKNCCESGHHQEVTEIYAKICEISNAIWLLTDNKYFNNMWATYMKIEG